MSGSGKRRWLLATGVTAVVIIVVIAAVNASAQQTPVLTPQFVPIDAGGHLPPAPAVGRRAATLGSARDITNAQAGKAFRVRVVFWNDSAQVKPAGAVIALGDIAFHPDADKPTDSVTLRALPRNVIFNLVVEPDGARGKKIVTPVRFTSRMSTGSMRDAINVEVTDSEIRVVGNPLVKYDVTVPR